MNAAFGRRTPQAAAATRCDACAAISSAISYRMSSQWLSCCSVLMLETRFCASRRSAISDLESWLVYAPGAVIATSVWCLFTLGDGQRVLVLCGSAVARIASVGNTFLAHLGHTATTLMRPPSPIKSSALREYSARLFACATAAIMRSAIRERCDRPAATMAAMT
jgi:hypothetical protein